MPPTSQARPYDQAELGWPVTSLSTGTLPSNIPWTGFVFSSSVDNVPATRPPGVHPPPADKSLTTLRRVRFRSRKLQRALTRHDMVGSMGQVGSAGDNAAMESFFALLQKNVLDRQRWDTHDELRIAIITWIERTYHRRCRQASLGR